MLIDEMQEDGPLRKPPLRIVPFPEKVRYRPALIVPLCPRDTREGLT